MVHQKSLDAIERPFIGQMWAKIFQQTSWLEFSHSLSLDASGDSVFRN